MTVTNRLAPSFARLVVASLSLGLPLAAPMDGAVYAYCDVTRHSNDSMDFAKRMLAEAFVAATPGRDFELLHGVEIVAETERRRLPVARDGERELLEAPFRFELLKDALDVAAPAAGGSA